MTLHTRVLNCFFENLHILFEGVVLKKYVPPISGLGVGGDQLPDSPSGKQNPVLKTF